MKASLKLPLAIAAVLSLLLIAVPASAHSTHTTMNLTCADPNPQTTNTPASTSCSFTFNPGDDFGTTSNDKVDKFELWLPSGSTLNEDNDQGGGGSDGNTDPADGDDVGTAFVTTELWYNLCNDNDQDANTTYTTEWDNDWNAYSEGGWTKEAEYNTVFSVAGFFTENVPSHVMKNNTTGQYKVVTDMPQGQACDGATTVFNPLNTYAYANNNSSNPFIGKNPATSGCYEVKIVAYEVGGTTHTDVDTVDVGGNAGC